MCRGRTITRLALCKENATTVSLYFVLLLLFESIDCFGKGPCGKLQKLETRAYKAINPKPWHSNCWYFKKRRILATEFLFQFEKPYWKCLQIVEQKLRQTQILYTTIIQYTKNSQFNYVCITWDKYKQLYCMKTFFTYKGSQAWPKTAKSTAMKFFMLY